MTHATPSARAATWVSIDCCSTPPSRRSIRSSAWPTQCYEGDNASGMTAVLRAVEPSSDGQSAIMCCHRAESCCGLARLTVTGGGCHRDETLRRELVILLL